MKVALIIPYNPIEEVGGLELGTLRLAQTLKKHGIDSDIITFGQNGECEGINVMGFKNMGDLCLRLSLCKDEYDVFHWLEIFPNNADFKAQVKLSRKLKDSGKTIIFMVATSGNLEQRGGSTDDKHELKKSVDAFIISNPDQFAEFSKFGLKGNIYDFGLGLDTHRMFTPASSREKIILKDNLGLSQQKILYLFMGRFVQRKRPDFLLRAWEKVSNAGEDVELVIVGSGMDQHDSIEGEVITLAKKSKKVIFRDITKCPQDYYRACDVFLLPSGREGQPNVLLESMACGMPVIGSDIPGIREMIQDKKSGLLFPKDDMGKFIEDINYFIKEPRKIAQYGEKARKIVVKSKDIKDVAELYIDLYRKIIKEKNDSKN